jgi:phage terminase large subunit GpA-like protein
MMLWMSAVLSLTMSLAIQLTATERTELSFALTQARAPRLRLMSEWAESEVILPNGPFAGERYRHHRHPVSKIWFDELDSGRWSRAAATGPSQNGKTLQCYVIPVLWHLFEVGETVIVGLPDMNMANDKWQQDFKPVIQASPFRDLMPNRGEGSKGGNIKSSITFANGATLRFMSGGGNDKKRAGYTSRVVAVTETDGMDEAGEQSREADKIEQLEARTRAFGRTGKRIYLECTVSIERGRIWQEIKQGSDSKIMRPCPHCGVYVCPEREHLIGWETAESEEQAAAETHFFCPACGELWTESQRLSAAKRAKLVHRGQEITNDGVITGPIPQTQTLGFRWSAIDNPFITAGDLGAEEWKAKRSKDPENAEKKMRQFIWAIPYEPPDVELTPLDAEQIASRKSTFAEGVIPPDCLGVVIGVDTGKRKLHWVATAVMSDGRMFVIKYGTQPVRSDELGVHGGLVEALGKLRKFFAAMNPRQVWIDSGYHEHTDAIYAFCMKANEGLKLGQERYRPSKGYGEGQQRVGRYWMPEHKDDDVLHIGREFHIKRVRRGKELLRGVLLVHVNADHWKSELHQRLMIPPGEPKAIVLYDAPNPFEHSEISQHYVAERQMSKFVAGRGEVIVWDRVSRENHKLDASYLAIAAGEFVIAMSSKPEAKPRPSLSDLANKAKRVA